MQVRYMGFDHIQSARAFHFEVLREGEAKLRRTVVVDLRLFLEHRVSIQEGPALSACKLTADLQNPFVGTHELTADDLRAYAARRAADDARRAGARKSRRTEEDEFSPMAAPRAQA